LRGFGAILEILLVEGCVSKRSRWRGRCNQPLDTDDKDQFWLLLDVEGSLLSAQAGQSNLLTLGIAVLLYVGLGALEDNTALLFVCLSDQTC
jgi:hypothetical protein